MRPILLEFCRIHESGCPAGKFAASFYSAM